MSEMDEQARALIIEALTDGPMDYGELRGIGLGVGQLLNVTLDAMVADGTLVPRPSIFAPYQLAEPSPVPWTFEPRVPNHQGGIPVAQDEGSAAERPPRRHPDDGRRVRVEPLRHRRGGVEPHVVPNERGMVTCNGVIYTEGEPGKCWVGEDHSCITNPTIIGMLEGALFQAILKGNDPAPTQGDQQ